jgi:hypothetical protein
MLRNILLTYTSSGDFETGYVQGMNDLAAPILETIGKESMSFWVYKGFMERMVDMSDVGTQFPTKSRRNETTVALFGIVTQTSGSALV